MRMIRDRITELDITYDTLDEIAGLPTRYSSKVLGPNPAKRYSVNSLLAVCGALGLSVVLQPDAVQVEALRKRSDWILRRIHPRLP